MKFLSPCGGDTPLDGYICSPQMTATPRGVVRGKRWAADLGALQGPSYVKRMDFNKSLEWLRSMGEYRAACMFVAGFDVVGSAQDTLDAFAEFAEYYSDWPLSYCAQNGSENLPFPDGIKAIFIAGDTAWKESMAAVSVIKRGQSLGLHIHVGRVNWGRRYRLFGMLKGSNSFTCDGTRVRFDGRQKTFQAWQTYQAQLSMGLL